MSSKPKPKRKNRQTGKVAKQSKPNAPAKAGSQSGKADSKGGMKHRRALEVLVVIFAVVMVASMLLPSLSNIFSSSSSSSSAATTEAATTSDDASTEAATTTTDSIASIDAEYSDTVATLESKLSSDPDNLATLINVANDYFQWGYQASSYATTSDETAHVSDLLSKAESYYTHYLELNDSPSVHVDLALCHYYSGDVTGAQTLLEQYTQTNPDFGPAWANLGLVYLSQNLTDQATTAFNKAIETDPDDTYGAKSYAEQYLSYIESATSATTSSSSSSTGTSTSTGTSLSDTLAGVSGTGL